MTLNSKQKKFFDFLVKYQKLGKVFSVKMVTDATGWQPVTFKTYLAKGQLSDFISEASSGKFEAHSLLELTFEEFTQKLSQSKNRRVLGHNCKNALSRGLLKKSLDNMMLALELYNRPSLENKIDGFIVLFCIAWEQLLKAMIIEKFGEPRIYTKNKKLGLKQTISLRDSLAIILEGKNKIKLNIEKIAYWRDCAVHLLMPELQGITSRVFQSGVLNYSSTFEDFCETPFISSQHTGMISLVGDFNIPPVSVLKNLYGSAAVEMLELATFTTKEIEESDDIEFAIPLNVKLVFARDNAGTDIILTKADKGMKGLKDALIVEKAVDPEKSHPYSQKKAILQINNLLTERYDKKKLESHLPKRNKQGSPEINQNCFQSLIYKLKWKNANNQYHHLITTTGTHLYSQLAVDEIIIKIMNNDGFLVRAKKQYSRK